MICPRLGGRFQCNFHAPSACFLDGRTSKQVLLARHSFRFSAFSRQSSASGRFGDGLSETWRPVVQDPLLRVSDQILRCKIVRNLEVGCVRPVLLARDGWNHGRPGRSGRLGGDGLARVSCSRAGASVPVQAVHPTSASAKHVPSVQHVPRPGAICTCSHAHLKYVRSRKHPEETHAGCLKGRSAACMLWHCWTLARQTLQTRHRTFDNRARLWHGRSETCGMCRLRIVH